MTLGLDKLPCGFVHLRNSNDFIMQHIAIFASGNGTNAQRLIEYFAGNSGISIDLVLCNQPNAPVLARVKNLGVQTIVFNRTTFYETIEIPQLLLANRIDYLVLAGFLWLIPKNLLTIYPGRIINIHPALLPKYGGKGMYGMKVHEAVLSSGDFESGITIHYADENYDEGKIIFQAKCIVSKKDTPMDLAEKIHGLEYRYFPEIIEKGGVKATETEKLDPRRV